MPREICEPESIGSLAMNSIKPKLIDMHAHIHDMQSDKAAHSEISFREENGIFTVYCCKNPEEWNFYKKLGVEPVSAGSMLSFGIHPWDSGRFDPAACMELYEAAPIIGEIGLDSVWTDVPHETQLESFKKQLKIAADLNKPIILHTKGCEREIAGLTKGFPCPVLIHWFSGTIDELNLFIEQDCYFTLGPSGGDDELRKAMLSRIPRERLLIETDGLDSIYWAQDQLPPEEPDYTIIPESLKSTAKCIADYDCVDIESTTGQINSVFNEFVYGQKINNGKCLIISGGEEGPIPFPDSFSLVVAADKGLKYAFRAGIQPDIVVGDFDSFTGEIDSLNVLRLPVRKNDSDCQSAVVYALEQGYRDITLCCIMGGRLDHMIANIQVASYAAKRGALCTLLGSDDEVYVFTDRTVSFPRRDGCSFSVFALSDRCEGIDITGADYTVSDFTLTNDLSRGLSNGWTSDSIDVTVRKGILAVIISKYR